MAIVYYTQAKYPEALKLHEDVLAIRVAKLGLEHPLVADTKVKSASPVLVISTDFWLT